MLRVRNGNDECFEDVNVYAHKFTLGIEALLRNLSSEGSMKYTVAQSYDMTMTLINDPVPFSKFDILYLE